MSKKDNNDITIIDDLGLSPEILAISSMVQPFFSRNSFNRKHKNAI